MFYLDIIYSMNFYIQINYNLNNYLHIHFYLILTYSFHLDILDFWCNDKYQKNQNNDNIGKSDSNLYHLRLN